MEKSSVRVAKHRIEKNLESGKFPTKTNLRILKEAKINIRPYIKQFKQNLDLLITE